MNTGYNDVNEERNKTKRNVVRIFNKEGLMKAAIHAEERDSNRSVYAEVLQKHIDSQDDDTKYPILYDMIHNDVEFRIQIAVGDNESIWLDIDIEKLDELTTWQDVG